LFETVKKMLGIIKEMLGMRSEILEGFDNNGEIVLKRDPQGISDMNVPGFTENGDAWSFCFNQCLQVWILVNRFVEIPGGTERSQLGMLEALTLHGLEEFYGTGVGARPTALDKIYTKFIELMTDANPVFNREVEIFSLGTIA
jgi:hypothetical protein